MRTGRKTIPLSHSDRVIDESPDSFDISISPVVRWWLFLFKFAGGSIVTKSQNN